MKKKPKKYFFIFSGLCHEKMAKNTTFPMKIWLFLMCLVIPEVQIPQKQRFWPSGRGFQLQKVLKTLKNRWNIAVRCEFQYFGCSIVKKSEKFIVFLAFTGSLWCFGGLFNITSRFRRDRCILKEPNVRVPHRKLKWMTVWLTMVSLHIYVVKWRHEWPS